MQIFLRRSLFRAMFRHLRHERPQLQYRMHRLLKISIAFLAFLAVASLSLAGAAPSEKRLALVIGNASYKAKTLATPVNDAALIAQTLQAAGFDVIGARDLDEDLLRQTFRDFIDNVRKAGPNAVAAVYFAGYGIQLDGENYLIPIDADVTEASDMPLRAVRLSEQTQALAALHLKTTFMILDAARASPFALSGQPPASGLAWVEPETNMLIAFNAAPGTVSPDDGNGYGPYAKALAEMIREGGLTPAKLFDRVRLRVNELTKGTQVPWDTSEIETKFMFFERGPGAPPRADSPERTAGMRSQPMRSLGPQDAYMVALLRDTFDAYADFLADYWHDPLTKRVRALLAARREAITWGRTYEANVPNAYWSYLERFPRGPHVADARRLLTRLGAAIALPSQFKRMEYDVPPPLPDEQEYVERTALVLNDPAFAFEPLQPSPVYFLEPPPPPELLALAPPAAPSGAHILPTPMFGSLPVYVSVPADVVAPPNPFVFNNAHETLITNTISDAPTKPDRQAVSSLILPPGTAGSTNNPADGPGLPPLVGPTPRVIDSVNPPPPIVKPVASEQIKTPPSPPLPEVFLTSPLLTDDKIPPNRVTEPPALATDNEPQIPVATTLTPPPISIPPHTPRTAMLSPNGRIPLPIPRPVTLELSSTGLPLRNPLAAIPSPGKTDRVPLPIPRPVTFAPPSNRNQPKPITRAASMSSPTAVNQAGQPPAPPLNRSAPSTHLAHPPKVVLGVSAPQPQKELCPLVNGRRDCN